MKSIVPRTAAAIAAALLLAGCDDPTRPLAPSAPRTSLADGSASGSTIAFRSIGTRCGVDMNAGCSEDVGGWGWSTWTGVATIGADGTGSVHVTYPMEDNTLSRTLAPAWSPDGMRIAFHDWGEILVVAGAGGTPLNLTRHPADDREAAWSPDGARIAFRSDRSGPPELYVMNAADGSNVVRLTNGIGFTGHPDWSADGTRILFDCMVEAGNADVCAVNADGTGLVRLTSDAGYDGAADWSPAGRIAFVTARYGGAAEIAVMNGDGSGVGRLGAGIAGEHPDWSPDGSRIAFSSGLYLYVMASDGSSQALLTTGTSPSWRPSAATLPPVQPPVARLGAPTCVQLGCTFDGSGSTDDVGTGSLYYMFWSFGDGDGGYFGATPAHGYAAAGTYTVTLTVAATATGLTSTTSQSVTVTSPPPVIVVPPPNQPPVAAFGYTCARTRCTFDGRSSTDDQGIVSYTWDLGGASGASVTGAVVAYDYRRRGTYAVTLVVRDAAGQLGSVTQAVTVAK